MKEDLLRLDFGILFAELFMLSSPPPYTVISEVESKGTAIAHPPSHAAFIRRPKCTPDRHSSSHFVTALQAPAPSQFEHISRARRPWTNSARFTPVRWPLPPTSVASSCSEQAFTGNTNPRRPGLTMSAQQLLYACVRNRQKGGCSGRKSGHCPPSLET